MRHTTRRLFGLLAALALFGTACAGSSDTTTEAAAGDPGDGIQVHGHWTIDVHDPDGSLATTHEFDNAFVGATGLVDILAGTNSVLKTDSGHGDAEWEVRVSGGLCGDPALVEDCVMAVPGSDLRSYEVFETLSLTDNGDSFTLEGSFTAENSADVTGVRTVVLLLTNIGSLVTQVFTEKDFVDADQTPVESGQVVTVKVDISFS